MRPAIVCPDPAMAASGLTVVGVRHHSPACAALVRTAILDLRPATVLVEGPADFNPFLSDLSRDHQLPVAIFSFHATPRGTHASYSPFWSASPEWVALATAREVGANARFCDLPSWHPDFGDRVNRFADPHTLHASRAESTLGRKLGEDGLDALWDALAEAAPGHELATRLDRYFDLLRPAGADDPTEEGRERFMAAHAAFALREAAGRPVLLVCGGWHAAAIRRYAAEASGEEPVLDPPGPDERTGSYLVPYDFERLDRFTGYAAGMSSPAYYQVVAEQGLDAAADWATRAIATALRKAGQVVSTADRIAWATHARALADIRGHDAVLRSDLLDSGLSTLVKEGLDAPAAWTQAGALATGAHPVVVAMLRALTGTRRGALANGTRQPPLLAEVETRLAEAGIAMERTARRIDIDWNVPDDRRRARLLHALRILGLPGLNRVAGPAAPEPRAPREIFRLHAHRDTDGVLIEASRWGGTLDMAAAGCLSERIVAAGDRLGPLSACLHDAVFAGLLGLDGDLTTRLREGVGRSHEIAAIGEAGRHAVALYRFGAIFGPSAHAGLGGLCEAVFARTAWLVETIRDREGGLNAIDALIACRDMLRDCPDLTLDRAAFLSTLARLAGDRSGAPALAGASLGLAVACGAVDGGEAGARLSAFSLANDLGDYLSGLFALAREDMAQQEPLIAAIATEVAGWTDEDYLLALPAMRQAFAWFPPRERERLARAILTSQGLGAVAADLQAASWMRQRASPSAQAEAARRETEVARRLAVAGLLDTAS